MKRCFQTMIICVILVCFGATNLQAGNILDNVRQSGEVRCGVVDANLPGLSILDSTGKWTGFWVDMCRAIAAASVGDPEAVRYVPVTESTRAAALRGNAIDVMSANTTWILSREAGTGIRFAEPVLYDGQGFLGRADAKDKNLKSFGPARVCVRDGTTTLKNLQELAKNEYPDLIPVPFQSAKTLMEGFFLQKCDLLTADKTILATTRMVGDVAKEHFVLLPETLVMIKAEEKGITSANVDSFANSTDPEIRLLLGFEGGLGDALGLDNAWAMRIIHAVGNYGEVFDRNLGPNTPMGMERGENQLWSKGGLMYSTPVR